MPFVDRVVQAFPIHREDYEKTNNILETVSTARMIGLLHQLHQISEYSKEIMENLFNEAKNTCSRIKNIGERVLKLEETVPKIEDTMLNTNPQVYFSSKQSSKFTSAKIFDNNLFIPDNRPKVLQAARDKAHKMPDFSPLDKYCTTRDDKDCGKDYSNPGFFLEEWVTQQLLEMEKEKERKKRRKKRKKKKKKKQKKEEFKAVEIKMKTYNAMGAEFAGGTNKQIQGREAGGMAVNTKKLSKGGPHATEFQNDPSQEHGIPDADRDDDIPDPMDLIDPSMDPNVPDIGDMDLDLDIDFGEEDLAYKPKVAVKAAGGNVGAAGAAKRGGLLGELQSRKNDLKKVDDSEKNQNQKAQMGSIMEIMRRRKAIEVESDSDSDSDSDFEF